MGGTELPGWVSCQRADPVPWLLEDSNPCVRYRALRELLGRPTDDAEVQCTVEAIWVYLPIADLLSALVQMEAIVWEL